MHELLSNFLFHHFQFKKAMFCLERTWIFCGKILNDLGIHIIVVGQIDLWSFHDVTFSMPEFVLMGGKDIEFILIITVVFRIKKKQ